MALALNGLAIIYSEQGKYSEAESLYQRVLHIREQQLAPVARAKPPGLPDLGMKRAHAFKT